MVAKEEVNNLIEERMVVLFATLKNFIALDDELDWRSGSEGG